METTRTQNFSLDTCDWPGGIEREQACNVAFDRIMNAIRELPETTYNELVLELTDPAREDSQPIREKLETLGYDAMEERGFRAGLTGCNMSLYWTGP